MEISLQTSRFSPKQLAGIRILLLRHQGGAGACLLYTSDAADERSSVDLGGRRIIKKKTHQSLYQASALLTKNDYKEHMHTRIT